MAKITIEMVRAIQKRLKPCPFCGRSVEISIYDDEGNEHNADYLQDPYSGVMFAITHHKNSECIMKNSECILDCDPLDNEKVGNHLYSDLCEIMKYWNRRSEVH